MEVTSIGSYTKPMDIYDKYGNPVLTKINVQAHRTPTKQDWKQMIIADAVDFYSNAPLKKGNFNIIKIFYNPKLFEVSGVSFVFHKTKNENWKK